MANYTLCSTNLSSVADWLVISKRNLVFRRSRAEKGPPPTTRFPAPPHLSLPPSLQLQDRHRCDSTAASRPVRRSAIGGGSSPPLEPLRRRGLCEFPAGSSSIRYALHALDVLLLPSTDPHLSAILAPAGQCCSFDETGGAEALTGGNY
jgi:hypothetical protein